METSNNVLFNNSDSLAPTVRIVKSKRKEDILLASPQIPDGGILVVVSYGDVGYVKITDGSATFATLKKIGEGGDSEPVTWDTLSGKPTVIAAGSTASEAASELGITAAGLALASAANLAAQQTLLGLQALAYLSTIGTAQIADSAVTLAKLAANSVNGSKIADGSIANAKISATANIDLAKLANVAAGQNGLAAGGIQATFQAIVNRIFAVERPYALPAAIGTAGQVLAVNAAGNGLEWVTPA